MTSASASTLRPRRGKTSPLAAVAVLAVSFAAAIPRAVLSSPAMATDGEDIPVTPAGSALRSFGLYAPFEGGLGEGVVHDPPPSPSPCAPRHVHLSLGDDDEPSAGVVRKSHASSEDQTPAAAAAMTVSFSVPSKDATCHPEKLRVSVAYKTDGGEERRQYARAEDDVRWYNATSDRTGAYYDSDWLYHVQLKGLDRDAEYRYSIEVEQIIYPSVTMAGWVANMAASVGDWIAASTPLRRLAGAAGGGKTNTGGGRTILAASPTLSFRTPPPPGYRGPTKIALLGDLGQTYNSTQTVLNLLRETELDPAAGHGTPASLLFCAGDMSYADTDQSRWDNWFALVEPLVSRTALQVTAGNHEIECDAVTHTVFAAYENRFRMPNPTGPAKIQPVPPDEIDPLRGCGTPSVFRGSYDGGNAYYAFTHGMVRFVALSPYSDASLGSRQYRWLEAELKGVDRVVTPWVVVVHHVQFYTTFVAHNDEVQTTVMRQAMEPLFVRYRVNLVVSGHDHAYMRSKPMAFGASDPAGRSPVYIIVGEGGNREHHVKDYLHAEPEEWVDRRDRTEYGFGTFEAANATWSRWRWVRDGSLATGSDGAGVTDDAWLRNQYFL